MRISGLRFKRVLRRDHAYPLLRLFRVMWEGPGVNRVGAPISHKFSVGFRPRIYERIIEMDGTILTLFGVRFHHRRSYSGRFE